MMFRHIEELEATVAEQEQKIQALTDEATKLQEQARQILDNKVSVETQASLDTPADLVTVEKQPGTNHEAQPHPSTLHCPARPTLRKHSISICHTPKKTFQAYQPPHKRCGSPPASPPQTPPRTSSPPKSPTHTAHSPWASSSRTSNVMRPHAQRQHSVFPPPAPSTPASSFHPMHGTRTTTQQAYPRLSSHHRSSHFHYQEQHGTYREHILHAYISLTLNALHTSIYATGHHPPVWPICPPMLQP
jgi:hypothetical protein